MNIPCDNCKVIRQLSGHPLRCDVCGWECDAASRRETGVQPVEPPAVWTGEEALGRGNLLKVGVWGIVIVGVVYLALHFGVRGLFLTPGKNAEPAGQYGIALKYNVTMEQVVMDPKPKGCDFTDAPVGDKHCRFEPSLNVVRKCLTPDCPVERVYVSWRKVRTDVPAAG
jgi:hypothetical protein